MGGLQVCKTKREMLSPLYRTQYSDLPIVLDNSACEKRVIMLTNKNNRALHKQGQRQLKGLLSDLETFRAARQQVNQNAEALFIFCITGLLQTACKLCANGFTTKVAAAAHDFFNDLPQRFLLRVKLRFGKITGNVSRRVRFKAILAHSKYLLKE